MGLKINGSTSGSIEIDVPAVAGTDTSITIPATSGGEFIVSDSSGNIDLGPLDINGSASDDSVNIDASGRLLIGTTNATDNARLGVKVGVVGTSSYPGMSITGYLGTGGSFPIFDLTRSRGTTDGSYTKVESGDVLGRIHFRGSDGTQWGTSASIDGVVDNATGTSDLPGKLVFKTSSDGSASPTERMRIRYNGEVSISNSVHVVPSDDNAVPLGLSTNRWSAVYAANGTIQTSDERTKTDVADSVLASDFIKSLRPVSYKWIEGGKRHTGQYDEDNNWVYESVPGQRTHWGFIAQEVKEAVDAAGVDFGGWVLTDKDDPESQQALRYDQFIAPLTKALQEALAKIETLETANASLEARLTALEGGAS